MPDPLYVKRAEAARLLGLSSTTLDRYVAAGLIPSVKPAGGRTAARLFPVADLKTLAQRWAVPRLPSEQGILVVDPNVQAADFRGTDGDRDYAYRCFRLPDRTPLEITDLDEEARIAVDGLHAEAGALRVVSVNGSTETPWKLAGQTFHGPAIVAGRALEAEPAKGRDLGLRRLVDLDRVRTLIDFNVDDEAGAADTGKEGAA